MLLWTCRHEGEDTGSPGAAAEQRQQGTATGQKGEHAGPSAEPNLAPPTPSYAAPKEDPPSRQPRWIHHASYTSIPMAGACHDLLHKGRLLDHLPCSAVTTYHWA